MLIQSKYIVNRKYIRMALKLFQISLLGLHIIFSNYCIAVSYIRLLGAIDLHITNRSPIIHGHNNLAVVLVFIKCSIY